MSGELVQGRDYYLENGRWVFTAYYLRQRGYCCQSGCRHCPYGFRKPPPEGDRPDRGPAAEAGLIDCRKRQNR